MNTQPINQPGRRPATQLDWRARQCSGMSLKVGPASNYIESIAHYLGLAHILARLDRSVDDEAGGGQLAASIGSGGANAGRRRRPVMMRGGDGARRHFVSSRRPSGSGPFHSNHDGRRRTVPRPRQRPLNKSSQARQAQAWGEPPLYWRHLCTGRHDATSLSLIWAIWRAVRPARGAVTTIKDCRVPAK
jgi:hypothetical protein